MPEKLKALFTSLNLGEKLFALSFFILILWGLFLLTPVLTGDFSASVSRQKVEESRNYPAFQYKITALLKRGTPQSVIDKQLSAMFAEPIAAYTVQREKAILWGLAAIVVVGLAILTLIIKKDLPKEKRNLLLGAIITVMLIQGFTMAVRYIIPDDRDLSCPEGIKKLAKLDKLYRVHAINKAFYNPWISEYFPLYDIPTIDVPADSRPSVWRKAFFYGDDFKIAKRLLYANVRYVLGGAEELGYLKSLGVQFDQAGSFSFQGQRQTIGELKKSLPRFYAPQSAVLVPKIEDALTTMNKADTDPLAVCLLQSGEPAERGEGTNTLSLVNFTPEKVELQTSFDFPGYAVLACEPLEGWHAEVDGVKTDVVRCNLMQQAVAVPQGNHKVTFIFNKRDPSSAVCDFMHAVFLPVFAIITLAALFLKKKNAE